MRPNGIFLAAAVSAVWFIAWPAHAEIQPSQLRCEYLANPQGIDVAQPRLSWVPLSDERGQRQTAYRVLVAGSPEKLQADEGDLWDSGRVESSQTIHVAYAGKPLASRTQCWWKVQLWDKDGKPSPWSEPATWSMGLLAPADWKAQWIADPVAAARAPSLPHNGYHSQMAASADVAKWVAVDLGEPKRLDAVRLYPARPFDWTPDTPGFLFPLRFKIEVADRPDFSDAKAVVDQTAADVPNPGTESPVYRFAAVTARYVRLTATRLRLRDPGNYGLALAEMQVLDGQTNLAQGAKVTAADSIEVVNWSTKNLVDGRLVSARGNMEPMPAAMFRKDFRLAAGVRRATLYATARGLYELHINGQRVGDHLLAPEWTEYDHRIQYQTYDVTRELREGDNMVGAVLGDGWYAGRVGLAPPPGRYIYGSFTQLLAQLEIELADGSRVTVATDPTWTCTSDGPIRLADILDGETHDARKPIAGWDVPGLCFAEWYPVHAAPLGQVKLVAQRNEPIRVIEELKPVKLAEPKPGVFVFDLGQNMVGWCRFQAQGPAGTEITLRFGEMLNDDGTLYTANLRGAAQRDQFILDGRGVEVFEPSFTYHGFRYVQVTGLAQAPKVDDLLGRVICSSSPEVSSFECSNALVNQLMHNVLWTQRANLYSVPTDCPQRDERLGWMGDIQAFSQTAVFNMDMAGFFTKWVQDIRDAQLPDGRFPNFAPRAFGRGQPAGMGVPAWADAGTVVPWRTYVNYADRRMIEEHFPAACRWVDYVHGRNPNLLWQKDRSDDYNDWLNGDTLILEGYPKGGSAVPNEVFATAFFAHSAEIVAKMARVLGRQAEAEKYGRLFQDIKAAFNREYVAADGRIKGDTQAGYVLALHFNLLDEGLRPKAMEYLLEAIQRYKGHPSTGIQTTHRMLLELSRNGRHDEACRLVNLRTVPSWGFMIDMGATTIWERWDGYVKGRGFQNPGMNSFNHWAFGSVGEWVWREIVGIQPDEERPGYEHFFIRPGPADGFTWARGTYGSIRGPITSSWRVEGGTLTLEVTVPCNATATVYVPTTSAAQVTESGRPAGQSEGVRPLAAEPGAAVFHVQSGHYTFSASIAPRQDE